MFSFDLSVLYLEKEHRYRDNGSFTSNLYRLK